MVLISTQYLENMVVVVMVIAAGIATRGWHFTSLCRNFTLKFRIVRAPTMCWDIHTRVLLYHHPSSIKYSSCTCLHDQLHTCQPFLGVNCIQQLLNLYFMVWNLIHVKVLTTFKEKKRNATHNNNNNDTIYRVLTLIKNDNSKCATHTENEYNNFQGTLEASPGSEYQQLQVFPMSKYNDFPVMAELPMLYHCTQSNWSIPVYKQTI